jgi:hypothetical protein
MRNKMAQNMMDMSDSEDEDEASSDAFVDPKTEAFLLGQLLVAVRPCTCDAALSPQSHALCAGLCRPGSSDSSLYSGNIPIKES